MVPIPGPAADAVLPGFFRRLALGQSTRFTSVRSLVRTQYRPPVPPSPSRARTPAMTGASDGTPHRSRRHVPVHRHRGLDAARASVGLAAWATIVARHDRAVARGDRGERGAVVKTEGDAFFAVFDRPTRPLAPPSPHSGRSPRRPGRGDAAAGPDGHAPRARAGFGTAARPGDPEDYVGIDVNYAARIAAAGNGGQIVAVGGGRRGARGAARRRWGRGSSTMGSAPSRTSRSRRSSIARCPGCRGRPAPPPNARPAF